jgi:hypothetical protein
VKEDLQRGRVELVAQDLARTVEADLAGELPFDAGALVEPESGSEQPSRPGGLSVVSERPGEKHHRFGGRRPCLVIQGSRQRSAREHGCVGVAALQVGDLREVEEVEIRFSRVELLGEREPLFAELPCFIERAFRDRKTSEIAQRDRHHERNVVFASEEQSRLEVRAALGQIPAL